MHALVIAWKDTRVRFSDRNAIMVMLIAPIVLSLIMGAAFGKQTAAGGIGTPVTVAVVNADTGTLGQEFVAALGTGEAAHMVRVQSVPDQAVAEAAIASGEARAALLISADFSAALTAYPANETVRAPATVQVLADPAAPIGAAIIAGIARQLAVQFGTNAVARQIFPAASTGDMRPIAYQSAVSAPRLVLRDTPLAGTSAAQSPLAFFVPSMAIFFLMFTMFDGPRSLLVEQTNGTLNRIITTPAQFWQVLLGKLLGTFASGVLQFALLVLGSRLFLQVDWGSSPLGLALIIVTFVAAASGIGALVAALAKDLTQATMAGSSLTLLFGLLGGNFVTLDQSPDWLQGLSMLSVNRWGLTGLTDLTLRGGGLADVLPEAGVLAGIAIGCFVVAGARLPRRFGR